MATWAGSDSDEATAAGTVSERAVRPHDVLTTAAGFARFEMGTELGRGGLGVVVAARDKALWRETAIKLIRDTRTERTVARFVEEAQITGQLEHPNIVPVHELGRDPAGRPYMAMKLVRGHTWLELINRVKRANHRSTMSDLIRDRRLDVFLKICDALAYAHSRRIVHRDLKPANIMVGEFGEVLVMDWGVAKPLRTVKSATAGRAGRKSLPKKRGDAPDARTIRGDADAPADDNAIEMTLDGEVLGTPAYMPPEQAAGEGDAVDERADIFCLGSMLFQAVTFQTPYRGATVWETVDMARRCERQSPRAAAPKLGIPAEIEAIIEKAMAPDPRDRYRNVIDLRRDIEAAMANQPITARRDGLVRGAIKWTRRHPTALAIGAVITVCLVLLGLAGSVMWAVQLDADRRAAQQQREIAERKAEAERLQREAAEQQAEAERLQREVDAKEAEREKAELVALAKDGLIDELRTRLGIKFVRRRGEVLEEFHTRMDAAVASGVGNEIDFIRSISRADADRYIAAFQQLVDLSAEVNDASMVHPTDFYYLSVLWLWARGDSQRGREFADRALELDPGYPAAYVMRGLCFEDDGDNLAALTEYNRAAQIAPDDLSVLLNRANVREELGDSEGAFADYAHAIRVASTDPDVWYSRGELNRRLRRLPAAIEDYSQAINLFPDLAAAWLNRSTVFSDMGLFDEAMVDANQAIHLNPESGPAHNNRAAIHMRVGDLAAARADLETAIRLGGSPQAYVNRAFVRAEGGDFAGAIPDYERGIREMSAQDPDNRDLWQVWYNLGVARARTGSTATAIEAFRAARDRCPDADQRAAIDQVIRDLSE